MLMGREQAVPLNTRGNASAPLALNLARPKTRLPKAGKSPRNRAGRIPARNIGHPSASHELFSHGARGFRVPSRRNCGGTQFCAARRQGERTMTTRGDLAGRTDRSMFYKSKSVADRLQMSQENH